ncbi:DUF6624 domain-containing protein [Rossellomorea aquimaris]|uniref:DUF6624 domain-containing protein n=1 Tax=Rossellomorea aquimaris TaxID=189382 RepID=UPI0007D07973|nr:DUF6624 domain-containing protein [Rossellomorea aquimaris]
MSQYQSITEQLIALKMLDQQKREQLIKDGILFEGYHPEMEKIHIENGQKLKDIIKKIGWPNKTKVGTKGAEAAWLVIQNAISIPDLQRETLPMLENEMKNGEIEPYQYAYLVDRVCFFERKPQRYGTQLDWDQNGNMSTCQIEDEKNVDKRREEMCLSPLQEEVERVQKEIVENHVSPPKDMDERAREVDEWRRRVGWI